MLSHLVTKWFHLFGGTRMAALTTATGAPDFMLIGIDGSTFSLKDALSRGPVALAFFKVSCPVCQYALPVLERVYEAHGSGVTIIGISQDKKRDTAAFMSEYGITFPVLLD